MTYRKSSPITIRHSFSHGYPTLWWENILKLPYWRKCLLYRNQYLQKASLSKITWLQTERHASLTALSQSCYRATKSSFCRIQPIITDSKCVYLPVFCPYQRGNLGPAFLFLLNLWNRFKSIKDFCTSYSKFTGQINLTNFSWNITSISNKHFFPCKASTQVSISD